MTISCEQDYHIGGWHNTLTPLTQDGTGIADIASGGFQPSPDSTSLDVAPLPLSGGGRKSKRKSRRMKRSNKSRYLKFRIFFFMSY